MLFDSTYYCGRVNYYFFNILALLFNNTVNTIYF